MDSYSEERPNSTQAPAPAPSTHNLSLLILNATSQRAPKSKRYLVLVQNPFLPSERSLPIESQIRRHECWLFSLFLSLYFNVSSPLHSLIPSHRLEPLFSFIPSGSPEAPPKTAAGLPLRCKLRSKYVVSATIPFSAGLPRRPCLPHLPPDSPFKGSDPKNSRAALGARLCQELKASHAGKRA